jgi:hypothetical protein
MRHFCATGVQGGHQLSIMAPVGALCLPAEVKYVVDLKALS